jgi:hypothetical protein
VVVPILFEDAQNEKELRGAVLPSWGFHPPHPSSKFAASYQIDIRIQKINQRLLRFSTNVLRYHGSGNFVNNVVNHWTVLNLTSNH